MNPGRARKGAADTGHRVVVEQFVRMAFLNTGDTLNARGRDELTEARLENGFHGVVRALGAPFVDRGEAAVFVLDAAASAVGDYTWSEWTSTEGWDIGKEGLRADGLIFLTAMHEAGEWSEAAVSWWFHTNGGLFDDGAYDPSGSLAAVIARFEEVSEAARAQRDGQWPKD